MDGRYVDTSHQGLQCGVQINLSPLAVERAFGISMQELGKSVVSLRELLPRDVGDLSDRLYTARTWDARFDLVEDILARHLADGVAHERVLTWALERLSRAHGNVDLHAFCKELGYSQRHVIAMFKAKIGVSPKQYCRLLRFDHALARLKAGNTQSFAALAQACGYCDQSHLTRELRHFAGSTPTELRALVAPLGSLFTT